VFLVTRTDLIEDDLLEDILILNINYDAEYKKIAREEFKNKLNLNGKNELKDDKDINSFKSVIDDLFIGNELLSEIEVEDGDTNDKPVDALLSEKFKKEPITVEIIDINIESLMIEWNEKENAIFEIYTGEVLYSKIEETTIILNIEKIWDMLNSQQDLTISIKAISKEDPRIYINSNVIITKDEIVSSLKKDYKRETKLLFEEMDSLVEERDYKNAKIIAEEILLISNKYKPYINIDTSNVENVIKKINDISFVSLGILSGVQGASGISLLIGASIDFRIGWNFGVGIGMNMLSPELSLKLSLNSFSIHRNDHFEMYLKMAGLFHPATFYDTVGFGGIGSIGMIFRFSRIGIILDGGVKIDFFEILDYAPSYYFVGRIGLTYYL
jgi:hypothetical protein